MRRFIKRLITHISMIKAREISWNQASKKNVVAGACGN